MKHDEAKIDEMVLALLYLTMFNGGVEIPSWKGHDWSAMGHLGPSEQGTFGRHDRCGGKTSKRAFREELPSGALAFGSPLDWDRLLMAPTRMLPRLKMDWTA
jgi:hypothetical protein